MNSLLCQETITINDGAVSGAGDDPRGASSSIGKDGDDDEYVEMLLEREISNGGGIHTCNISTGSWIGEVRLNAIEYILNTSVTFGFKIETTYLAVNYVDRFLSRRLIEDGKSWAVRLLAMACLSIAAKMEECRAPLLPEFPDEVYHFESEVIQKMELLVLSTLEWRMECATPFTFTPYFASKLCERSDSITETMCRANEIISANIKTFKMSYKGYNTSSSIAVAATLFVLDRRMSRETLELKISTLSSTSLLKIDDVVSFYNQMKEMNMDIFKVSEDVHSPVLSLGSSLLTSSRVPSKRKSLTFDDDDDAEGGQNGTMPGNKRREKDQPSE